MSEAGGRFPLRSWVERSWRGEGPLLAALTLRPLELLYKIGSAIARFRAARTRRLLPGIQVIAIGGLTVGGSGKTTLARWAARAALEAGRRPVILLRGHGSNAPGRAPQIVPLDAPSIRGAARRYGDEALAHRAALPESILVVTGKDRRKAASLALESGSDLAILDDGWEQGALSWSFLWVLLDSPLPFANGRLLPAGPLRRPVGNLRQANVIVNIAEAASEEPGGMIDSLAEGPPGLPRVRFTRRVESWTRLGESGRSVVAGNLPDAPRLVISSVGSPDRLERFLRGAGAAPADHVAFPDHGEWDYQLVERRAAELRARTGLAPILLVTDKDEARAAGLANRGLDVWVVRSTLAPFDDPAPLLAAFGRASGGSRGGAAGDRLG
ncbi:MAG: tetraacyldisaccharide 4'-kinase [Candidatus Eisenbacteria bacterium]